MIELKTLFDDINVLYNSAKDDLENERWANHPRYVAQYNSYLNAARENGIGMDLEEICQVPDEDMGFGFGPGAGTFAEKAKLGELKDESYKLIMRMTEKLKSPEAVSPPAPTAIIFRICDRFSRTAQRFSERQRDREPVTINDEYDVQYIFYGLLGLFFDDIRPEEYVPSYAGKNSRMDFLLKEEKIVIETKMTREGLRDGEVSDQLTIDIAHYKAHPDCKTLICFVYDPSHLIRNIAAIENDISGTYDGLEVRVLVRS